MEDVWVVMVRKSGKGIKKIMVFRTEVEARLKFFKWCRAYGLDDGETYDAVSGVRVEFSRSEVS